MSNFYARALCQPTPQNKPLLGENQVENDAGGYVFRSSDAESFKRFLILGSDTNSYYASKKKLTQESLKNTFKFIDMHPVDAFNTLYEVSQKRSAPKVSPTLMALAYLSSNRDVNIRKLVYAHLTDICRTASHLFEFIENVHLFRGWSRGLRESVSRFYERTDLGYQLIKYRNRNGFTHKNILKLAHPKPHNDYQQDLFSWLCRDTAVHDGLVNAFIEIQNPSTTVQRALQLINQYNLPWESIPTQLHSERVFWEALLPHMPDMALVRNLNRMSNLGMFNAFSPFTSLVEDKLSKTRLHPMKIFTAYTAYRKGQGRHFSWTVNDRILNALDNAFFTTMKHSEPSGKNILVAVDVSGSMEGNEILDGCTAARYSLALALAIQGTEPSAEIMAFDTQARQVQWRTKSLQSIFSASINGGGTDCSIPFTYAIHNKLKVDTFVLLSDSQTWYGNMHPHQAFECYLDQHNKDAKSVGIGLVADKFQLHPEHFKNTLNIAGYDSSLPEMISSFSGGF